MKEDLKVAIADAMPSKKKPFYAPYEVKCFLDKQLKRDVEDHECIEFVKAVGHEGLHRIKGVGISKSFEIIGRVAVMEGTYK